jgi:hypothetical protein
MPSGNRDMETIPAKKRKVYTVSAKNFDAQRFLVKRITELVDEVAKTLDLLAKKRPNMTFHHGPKCVFVNLYLCPTWR